jgi:hypothetical protein
VCTFLLVPTETSELNFPEDPESEHISHEEYNLGTPNTLPGVTESEVSELDDVDTSSLQDPNDNEDNLHNDMNESTQPESLTLEDQEEKADREQIKREQEKMAKEREAQAGEKSIISILHF